MVWQPRFYTPRRGWFPIQSNILRFLPLRWALAGLLLLFGSSFVPHSGWKSPGLAESLLSEQQHVENSPSAYLHVGEELHYKVKYWFIGLGEIKVRVIDAFQKNGETRYHAEVFVDSYSGNPFVNLHHYYETEFDSTLASHYFYGRWQDGDVWKYVKYFFHYDQNKVFIERGTQSPEAIEGYDTLDINRRYQDGLSLFYFARGYVKTGQKMVTPTFINEQKKRTYFNFMNKFSDEEIDSVSYPIDVVEFEGEADWVGIFGLTGGFRGWFSNDDARIPIVAKMKVIIGSVRVTLDDWKRNGWVPPEYKERD